MRDIYYIELNGRWYGIWKDEVSSVRPAPSIHRLPLSPAAIAGVAVVDDRSAAVADLSVCMGLRPILNIPGRRLLSVAGRDAGAVFLVSGALSEMQVPVDGVHPIPEFLKTDDADTCVIRDGMPVPVINIIRLHDRLQQHSSEPLRPSLAASNAPERSSLPTVPVRVVTAGKELFGISEAYLAGTSSPLSGLSAVSLTPRYVAGMAFHDGTVIPVLRIAERLGLSGNGAGGRLLVSGSGEGRFGMVVEEEQGTLQDRSFAVKALPPVAATGWCRDAAVSQGSIVPLLDPALLLSRLDEDDAVRSLPDRYRPEGRFAEAFERTSVEVLEFSLLGVRHALPKNEVEDILPLKLYRRLPGALPIVIGAAEHKGEVLPVLDLALVFGRRSLEKQNWSMILVRNGDFRALVITEDVFEERMLPREVQRKVPINLPHELVYGCYPEGVAVRLILNVEALAVHFDRALVADLLPALTPEMAEAPAELVHSLLPVAGEKEPEGGAEGEGTGVLTRSAAEERAIKEEEERRQHEEEERKAAELEKAAADERALREAEAKARQETEEQEQKARAAAEEEIRRKAEEETRLEKERLEAEELARREAERAAAAAAMRAQQETEERARQAAEEERQRQEAEELRKREEEERLRLAAEEQARREAEERARKEEQERQAREEAEKARAAAEEQARRGAEEAAARAKQEAEEQARRAEEERLKREADERERLAARERARSEAEAAQKAEQERQQREAEEQRLREERERAEAAARQKRESEEKALRLQEEERLRHEAEERRKREEEERARVAAEEQARREAEDRARQHEQERRALEEAERTRAAAAARQAVDAGEGRVVPGSTQDSRTLMDRVRADQTGTKRKDGWKLPAAVAAAVIVLLLLFIGLSSRGVKKNAVAPGEPVKTAGTAEERTAGSERQEAGAKGISSPEPPSKKQAAPGTQVSASPHVSKAAPEAGARAPKRAARREEKLVLTVPADRPLDTDVYIVKKGDTLWHICKRFTGNPFNYPRVARDNSIANPDLIFPDQRIELRK